MECIADQIGNAGVIVILRNRCQELIEQHLPRLLNAGMRVIEVSRVAQNYNDAMTSLLSQSGGHLLVGAGTIRSERDAEEAIRLGAMFLISPHFDPALTKFVLGNNIPYIVGCYTPSEVVAALNAGCSMIKIFPAFMGGPNYIKSLLAPFPEARFVPTGGVHPKDVPQYWEAGAWAVAIGSELTNSLFDNRCDEETLKQLFSGKQR